MFSGFGGPKATITVRPYHSVVYLHPPKEFEPVDAPRSLTLNGSVTLSFPKPREITSLIVKIVTFYNLAIPKQPAEWGTLDEFITTIPVPKQLDSGEHIFPWALEIPRNTAAQERCTFGRIYQRLQAIAESPSGTLKDDMNIDFVVNPADEGDTVGLNETIQGFQDTVGPYRSSLTSGHLTVGGVVHFTMNLASVPTEFRLHSVSAFFVQTFHLTSHKTGAHHTPASQQRQLFLIDARSLQQQQTQPNMTLGRPGTTVRSPSEVPAGENLLAFARKGEGIELSHLARMPIDDLLRPTTQPGSKTIIRVSQKVMIHVQFSASHGSPALLLRTERPVTISSCCCMLESLLLPPYSPQDDTDTRKGRPNRPTACICGFTFEHLLLKTHAPILKAHEEAGSGEPPVPHLTLLANKIVHTSP